MRRREPPLRECRGGCGRRKPTWQEAWLCRFCLLAERTAAPEAFGATRRARQGQLEITPAPRPPLPGETPGRSSQLRVLPGTSFEDIFGPRCAVCSGPLPDGAGCEHCPGVPA